MLAKRIIPCLDVDKGRVVKGVRFVNLRDAGDPVEAARAYNEAGADELVFLDITASAEQRRIMLEGVERTAAGAVMPGAGGGGGHPDGGRHPAAPECRRRQSLAEHGGGGTARAGS